MDEKNKESILRTTMDSYLDSRDHLVYLDRYFQSERIDRTDTGLAHIGRCNHILYLDQL